MWRSRFLSAVALLVSLSSQAQFGNEWINFNQRYFKFKVAEDDFYRISRAELQAIGFPVESVPASRIQLFREGEEVALNVSANVDNTLDFLEFYGLKRDGTSDTPLYLENTQPHTLYNLFSDSATYFLTFQLGSVNGKRMGFSSERNNQGVTPEAYHLQDTLAVFSDAYSPGRNIDSDGITLSDYDDGEGWTGTFFRKNQSRTFEFSLNGYNGLANTTFETVLFGGNNQDHNVVFSAGPDLGSQVPIGGAQFSEWSSELFISNILSTSIGADNALSITAFDEGFPNRSDRVSVGYVQVTYGSDFTIGSNENVVFRLDNIAERKAFLQIPTGSPSSFRAFNITDPFNSERLTTTNFQDRLEIVVSDVNFSNKILG